MELPSQFGQLNSEIKEEVSPSLDWSEMDFNIFLETFTQKQRDAIWQFFLDHSRINKHGVWKINFHVRDARDFWRRLFYRYTGQFKRYEVEKKLSTQARRDAITARERRHVKFLDRHSAKTHERITLIEKNGTLHEKFVLLLYRWSKKRLFKGLYNHDSAQENA